MLCLAIWELKPHRMMQTISQALGNMVCMLGLHFSEPSLGSCNESRGARKMCRKNDIHLNLISLIEMRETTHSDTPWFLFLPEMALGYTPPCSSTVISTVFYGIVVRLSQDREVCLICSQHYEGLVSFFSWMTHC